LINKIEKGNNRKPVRAMRRLVAAAGSTSVVTTRTITRSPQLLIQCRNAMPGNSDHIVLRAQYAKNQTRGWFAWSNLVTRGPLRTSTSSPLTRSARKMDELMGLDSAYSSVETDGKESQGVGVDCSHPVTGRDPAIRNQMTGIHRAFEARDFRSRSRKNSPAVPATTKMVTIVGDINRTR
jgi:hypothetical protein